MKKLSFLKIPLTNFTKMIFLFTNPSQWKIHTVAIFIRIIYIKNISIAFACYNNDNPNYSYSKNSFVMYPEWIYDIKWIIEQKINK